MTRDDLEGMTRRVLVVAPEGRDANVISQVLTGHGMAVEVCPDIDRLVDELRVGADTAFITEEALQRDPAPLTAWIAQQPPWSDFPFVLLVARRHGRRSSTWLDALMGLGNIVLLERPLNAETLITGARSALRVRARQYEAMRQLQAEASLRRAEQTARVAALDAAPRLGGGRRRRRARHLPLPVAVDHRRVQRPLPRALPLAGARRHRLAHAAARGASRRPGDGSRDLLRRHVRSRLARSRVAHRGARRVDPLGARQGPRLPQCRRAADPLRRRDARRHGAQAA